MSVLAFSACRIEYIPNNQQVPKREYSERSLIELRDNDSNKYCIRALDIEHKKTEIFNFTIKTNDQYEFGMSTDSPDKISDSNGTYHLWLRQDSRNSFHETLCAIFEAFFSDNSDVESTKSTPPYDKTTSTSDQFSGKKPVPSPDPVYCNPKDILTDVHNLSKSIQQGKANEASQLTKQLISQRIRVTTKSSKQLSNEEEFQITVQLDGNEYAINQNGGTIPVNVFPSTTIRELRAAFEIGYHYCPVNQYFFVNGKLASDNSTMKELRVGPNSLFVLFLITHPKQFKINGPWKCSACTAQNQPDSRVCRVCSASRKE